MQLDTYVRSVAWPEGGAAYRTMQLDTLDQREFGFGHNVSCDCTDAIGHVMLDQREFGFGHNVSGDCT